MAKKLAKKLAKKSNSRSQKTVSDAVSIVTPTTEKRKKVTILLAESIQRQTHISKIIEWVITSAEWSSADDFFVFIQKLQLIVPNVKIKGFFSNEKYATEFGWDRVENYGAIGYLRNITNLMSSGDFIVAMDDDDMYPITRVEHAVKKLQNSNTLVAGCSNHIMYAFDLNTTYEFKKFHDNHSINSVLAYKKEFLATGAKYDNTKTFAEEHTFLNGFTIPMTQLDPKHCVVQCVHTKNTFNKRKLILRSDRVSNINKNIFKLVTGAKGYVNSDILKKYKEALTSLADYEESEFDIVYYLGDGYAPFDLAQTNLGGSEQAVQNLCEHWVKNGKKVCVYGDFDKNGTTVTGVHFKNFLEFKCTQKYNILIFWRMYGYFPILKYKINAKRVFLDLHDNLPLNNEVILEQIDFFMVKSSFHATCLYKYNERYHNVRDIEKKIVIVPNGVRTVIFTPPDNPPERNIFKFVYASCYKRNLKNILKYLWPVLKQLESRAELVIMYGMCGVEDDNFKDEMRALFQQPGVTEIGRVSSSIVRDHKLTAGFHLYYSRSFAETDCISIRESACIGCIPILSRLGVFKERVGIHLEGDPEAEQDLVRAARQIFAMIQKEKLDDLEKFRSKNIGREIDWSHTVKIWMNHF
jgi:hypothetical protein